MNTNNLETKLSPHFTLWEMTRSGTAIQKGIVNTPDEKQLQRLRALCRNILEPLRTRFGMIRITSGFRCEKLNTAVGGAKDSQHLLGEAVDIHIASIEEGLRMCDYIAAHLDFDQLLLERVHRSGTGWIHVSYKSDRGANRHYYKKDYVVKR